MNNQDQNIFHLLVRLWLHITPRRRIQFGLLLVLMVITSFLEIISIGAVLPFLAILSDPQRVFANPRIQPIITALELTEPYQLLLPITILFGTLALIAGVIRLLLLWANLRLSYAAGADLGISIYRKTLYQPYEVHISRNSSEVINTIYGKTGIAINIINMVLNIIGSSIMLSVILIALISINASIAITVFGGFGLLYALIVVLTRKRLRKNSQTHARESSRVIKSLQEGLGGIRDVLIDGTQAAYCKIYSIADQSLRRAEGNSSFISSSPRSIVEALGILLITALSYWLAKQNEGISNVLPILGAIALGAQRLLPALQQMYGAWSSIQSSYGSLNDTLTLLEQPIPNNVDQSCLEPIPFERTISLQQINFRYSKATPYVLKNINLIIKKGTKVGFVGSTGSGKSTLIDIMMGLLEPNAGTIKIDDQIITKNNMRSWQLHISHVPQAIFIADSTIEENIAFGIQKDKINHKLIKESAQKAKIAETIESWPKQYQTTVGERGMKLSGGQRQRIGIARALYKKADVIILDEATSALDNETEKNVMEAIEGLGEEITIIIIAHRLTTLQNCTNIYEIGEGGVVKSGNYKQIIASSKK